VFKHATKNTLAYFAKASMTKKNKMFYNMTKRLSCSSSVCSSSKDYFGQICASVIEHFLTFSSKGLAIFKESERYQYMS
jgi:hypothetical protein